MRLLKTIRISRERTADDQVSLRLPALISNLFEDLGVSLVEWGKHKSAVKQPIRNAI